MNSETRAADGGLFRVINGRRVWIANPPTDYIKDVLTGHDCSIPEQADPVSLPAVLRLLSERSDAVPIEQQCE
jgi:hypothetical protein